MEENCLQSELGNEIKSQTAHDPRIKQGLNVTLFFQVILAFKLILGLDCLNELSISSLIRVKDITTTSNFKVKNFCLERVGAFHRGRKMLTSK